MTPAIRACLFDFDGTIADSLLMVLEVYNSVAGDLGLPVVAESEIPRLRSLGPLKAIDAYRVPLWKVPLALTRVRREIEKRALIPAVFPGLREVFEIDPLKSIRKMIVSSNSRANIERFAAHHAMGSIERIDSGASLFGKARRLRRLLQVTRLKPSEVVYVGDEVRDVEAAEAVGVTSIAVSWGYGDRASLAARRPSHLVDAPAQLGELLTFLVHG